jgi:uncharacterized protein YcbK (DUF882 family)
VNRNKKVEWGLFEYFFCYFTADIMLNHFTSQIDHIFRDRHEDETYPIDPDLLEVIAGLRDRMVMPADTPIELLSGYRSPASNANLAKTNKYVAKSSFHMKGKAADIRIPDMNSRVLEAVAKTIQRGGVALYLDSQHVHVDTGPVRGWSVVRGNEAGARSSVTSKPSYRDAAPIAVPKTNISTRSSDQKAPPVRTINVTPKPAQTHLPSVAKNKGAAPKPAFRKDVRKPVKSGVKPANKAAPSKEKTKKKSDVVKKQ